MTNERLRIDPLESLKSDADWNYKRRLQLAGENDTLRAAAQQALEALIVAWQDNPHWQITEAKNALTAALKGTTP